MGLFDKIKSAANFITGGGATVTVTPVEYDNDGNSPIKVKIAATIKDSNLKCSGVYLEIRGREVINGKFNTTEGKQNISEAFNTYKTKIDVAPAQTLEANQSYEWEAEFAIPGGNAGTYEGTHARHVWELFAGLDVPGNDPDSGWVEVKIRK